MIVGRIHNFDFLLNLRIAHSTVIVMALRSALLIPTCSAISFTRLAPEREAIAEVDRAVVGAPLQMVDFDGKDLEKNNNAINDDDGDDWRKYWSEDGTRTQAEIVVEQVQPPLSDYMDETNDTASDTPLLRTAASEESKLLLDDYINESNATASQPEPAAIEDPEVSKILAWEAQREASEESEQANKSQEANATASESQPTADATTSGARLAASTTVEEKKSNDDADEECEEAEPESACYDAVDWLRQFGFSRHPEWYPGYSSESTFQEVQAMLNGLGKASCPRPCLGAARAKPPACQDVVEGGCHDAIAWLKGTGLKRHPGWYPTLGTESSAAEIQAELFRQGKADCPAPCFLVKKERAAAAAQRAKVKAGEVVDHIKWTDNCMDAQVDTSCYTAVTYGMNEGISKHPNMYEGLRTASSFKKVQEYLYLNNRSGCTMPCPDAEVDLKTFNRQEELRVRKRVEDMSVKELGDFFSGKWDGYVASTKYGDWQPTTTSFEARSWEPTTSVPIEEQLLPQVDDDANDVVERAIDEMTNATEEVANATEEADNATEEMANATEEAANATLLEPTSSETEEMANATEPEAAANATKPEEAATGTVESANVSVELPQDTDIVDEATPEIENISTELPQDGDIVDEATPMVDTGGHEEGHDAYEAPVQETREEIEQRIRKQLMEEMHLQTTTVAAPQETMEEMRQRIKEELMREISQSKDQ